MTDNISPESTSAIVIELAQTLIHTARFEGEERRGVQDLINRDLAHVAMRLTHIIRIPEQQPVVIFRAGDRPVAGIRAHSLPYDMVEYLPTIIEPREEVILRHRLDLRPPYELTAPVRPYFGFFSYISLGAMAHALRNSDATLETSEQ